MALTTVSDVKSKLKRRYLNFDNTRWTDAVIGNMITMAQKEIEMVTGMIFDNQTITQKFHSARLSYPTDTLQLDYYPIVSVTSLTIDGATKTNNKDYYIDSDLGIIYFENYLPETGYNNIVIQYSAGYSTPYAPAKNLCEDMVVYAMFKERETPPNLKKILSKEEAELTEKTELLDILYNIQHSFSILPTKIFLGEV
jgi:hypothetical protein